MFRNKNTEGTHVGEKSQLIALCHGGIDNFIDKWPQQQGRVLDIKDDVSGIVLDNPRTNLVLRYFNDVHDKAEIGQGESLDFFFEETNDGRFEFLAEVDWL
mmetsp:Transcript_22929/g.45830  ORF Transcript_22929/g.45830 Transcript_22929/m.45830 type:complete len:101 (+) Transcript_22929:262-564(+)